MKRTHNDHPDCSRVSKRLNGSLDHVNVSLWDNAVVMKTGDPCIDPGLAWENGCVDAVDVLQSHPVYWDGGANTTWGIFLELASDGIITFRPHG